MVMGGYVGSGKYLSICILVRMVIGSGSSSTGRQKVEGAVG